MEAIRFLNLHQQQYRRLRAIKKKKKKAETKKLAATKQRSWDVCERPGVWEALHPSLPLESSQGSQKVPAPSSTLHQAGCTTFYF